MSTPQSIFLKGDKSRQICRVSTKSHVVLIMWIEHKVSRRSEIFPFTKSKMDKMKPIVVSR